VIAFSYPASCNCTGRTVADCTCVTTVDPGEVDSTAFSTTLAVCANAPVPKFKNRKARRREAALARRRKSA
jgi:hypothetical protein